MNALGHFLPKQNSRYDPIALRRMKKLKESMVWKVVYYGRCNSRKQPNTNSAICDEYNTDAFVEVFDYANGSSNKWLKIRGHGRNALGKKRKDAWILAVDPFCDMDLLVRATRKESRLAREQWGQAPKREFDSSPPRERQQPVVPAPDGEGPALPVAQEIPVEEQKSSDSEPSDPIEAPTDPNGIDPAMFKAATQAPTLDERAKAFLENETELRELRLQSLQKSTSPTSGGNQLPNDGSRDHWKRGTKVNVYSKSDKKWFLGVVASFQEEGGLFEKLEVHYKKNGQRHKKFIPRYHKSLRARISQAEPNTEGSPNTSPKHGSDNESNIAAGWTEHLCARTGRYYYNSKKEGKTVWDKQALTLGIISELKSSSSDSSKTG